MKFLKSYVATIEECHNTMNKRELQIVMLGTGHATVKKYYNTCFVLRENNECFMVDAGGGNQILRILDEQGIALSQVHNLFITHSHSDHILGAVWIIRMIGQMMKENKYESDFKIYANEQVIEGLLAICSYVLMPAITDLFGSRIKMITLQDGDSYSILNREITFFDIKSTKLLQFGFEIKKEKLLFCGDEPLKEALYHKATNLDCLLHEAFCLYSECDRFKPYEKHHSTVKDACLMAEKLKVKNLVLMHTEDSHYLDKKELYLVEGKKYYSGNLLIPNDGEIIILKN